MAQDVSGNRYDLNFSSVLGSANYKVKVMIKVDSPISGSLVGNNESVITKGDGNSYQLEGSSAEIKTVLEELSFVTDEKVETDVKFDIYIEDGGEQSNVQFMLSTEDTGEGYVVRQVTSGGIAQINRLELSLDDTGFLDSNAEFGSNELGLAIDESNIDESNIDEFIASSINHAPVVTSHPGGSTLEDTEHFIDKAEFDRIVGEAADLGENVRTYSDVDGDPIHAVRITELPLDSQSGEVVGKLFAVMSDGSEIESTQEMIDGGNNEFIYAEISGFNFVPNENYNGNVNFRWNASDGKLYADNDAGFSIVVTPAHDEPDLKDDDLGSISEHGSISGNLFAANDSDGEDESEKGADIFIDNGSNVIDDVTDVKINGESVVVSSGNMTILVNGVNLPYSESVDASGNTVITIGSGANPATLTINADGTYSFDAGDIFDYLAAGESIDLEFKYSTIGTAQTATAKLTINGEDDSNGNDLKDDDLKDDDLGSISEHGSISGNLFAANDSDGEDESEKGADIFIDNGSNVIDDVTDVKINGESVVVSSGNMTILVNGVNLPYSESVDASGNTVITIGSGANPATLTINADGTYSFDAGDIFDYLAAGESIDLEFKYSTIGTAQTATAKLTINGEDDSNGNDLKDDDLKDDDLGSISEHGSISGNLFAANDSDGEDESEKGADIFIDNGSNVIDDVTDVKINGESVVVSSGNMTILVNGVNLPYSESVDASGNTVITIGSGANPATLTINADGTYSFDAGDIFDYLAAGESIDLEFKYSTVGTAQTATAKLTINGEDDSNGNDLKDDDLGSISENGSKSGDLFAANDSDGEDESEKGADEFVDNGSNVIDDVTDVKINGESVVVSSGNMTILVNGVNLPYSESVDASGNTVITIGSGANPATLTINADGTYSFDAGDIFDYLAAGESIDLEFKYSTIGTAQTATAKLTINGEDDSNRNDLKDDDLGSISENGSKSGDLFAANDSDGEDESEKGADEFVDNGSNVIDDVTDVKINGESVVVSSGNMTILVNGVNLPYSESVDASGNTVITIGSGANPATLTINADGTYSFDAGDIFDYLAAGESIDLEFKYSTIGTAQTATAKLTINGEDDSDRNDLKDDDLGNISENGSKSGDLFAANDSSNEAPSEMGADIFIDNGSNVIDDVTDVKINGESASGSSGNMTILVNGVNLPYSESVDASGNTVITIGSGANPATLTINADGTYSFDAGDIFDYLAAGESIDLEFKYSTIGTAQTATAKLTINGEDDSDRNDLKDDDLGNISENGSKSGDLFAANDSSNEAPSEMGADIFIDNGSNVIDDVTDVKINGESASGSSGNMTILVNGVNLPYSESVDASGNTVITIGSGANPATLTINADGTYSFDAGDIFDYLAAGESIDLEFKYSTIGTAQTATAKLTINGEDDSDRNDLKDDDLGNISENGSKSGDLFAANDSSNEAPSEMGADIFIDNGSNVIDDVTDVKINGESASGSSGNMTILVNGVNLPYSESVDASGNTVITIGSGANPATLTINADGTYSFDAGDIFDYLAAGESIDLEFKYSTIGTAQTATAKLTIDGDNDRSTANYDLATLSSQSVLLQDDNVLIHQHLVTNVDTEGVILEVFANDQLAGLDNYVVRFENGVGANGILSIDADGNLIYTSVDVDDRGIYDFEYWLEDVNGNIISNEANITINLTGANTNIEDNSVFGEAGDDIITVNASVINVVLAHTGNDVVIGSESEDWIYGEDGNDWLYGGAGNDVLIGDEEDTEVDNTGWDNDSVFTANDVIFGGGGDDVIFGDTLYAQNNAGYFGNGADSFLASRHYIVPGTQLDTIIEGDDKLYGGEGDDRIYGGGGDDLIVGGLGKDTIYGDIFYGDQTDTNYKDGKDTFKYESFLDSTDSSRDVIMDFTVSGDTMDKIDLSLLGISFDNLSISYDSANGNTIISDTNSDFSIALRGDFSSSLSRDNFILAEDVIPPNSVTIDVLANDTDPEGSDDIDPTTLEIIDEPAHGAVEIVENDGKYQVRYTADPGYAGEDSFTYRFMDKSGEWSNEGVITINQDDNGILEGTSQPDNFIFSSVHDSSTGNEDLIIGFEDGLDKIDLSQITEIDGFSELIISFDADANKTSISHRNNETDFSLLLEGDFTNTLDGSDFIFDSDII